MGQYLSPGVYVEEVPSAVKAIAGVSTSTPGFIGVFGDELTIPFSPTKIVNEAIGTGDGLTQIFDLPAAHYPVNTGAGTYAFRVDGWPATAILEYDDVNRVFKITGVLANITDIGAGTGDGSTAVFNLPAAHYPVIPDAGTYVVRVNGTAAPADDVALSNDDVNKVSQITFDAGKEPAQGTVITVDFQKAPSVGETITGDYLANVSTTFTPVDAKEVHLCTTFTEFKKFFGDFSTDPGQRNLVHAVYGFFNNGGSRCYVVRVAAEGDITNNNVLSKFESIDEIAMVAAPGVTDENARSEIVIHCQVKTQDRFAIFDSPETVEDATGKLDLMKFDPSQSGNVLPSNSDFAAFYFPWIQVFDPATKLSDQNSDGLQYVPPSGHIAGIYARVDSQRGVHKAPANEAVFGALGLKYAISKAQQDGLNPQGVNCIRNLNGNNFVWGARTVGGDANADLKYINVRRTLLFIRESIDEGTQWVVFEPNTPELWQKITRNVSAFLTNVWRSGGLFGTTAQEAFYVKCDAETNPPELRELGQVVTEIGVAIVRPAEFVIFRISQWTPSK